MENLKIVFEAAKLFNDLELTVKKGKKNIREFMDKRI